MFCVQTRKFACFAIGNAGFHSDALYPELRVAVPPLVRLLGDEEDKTRANAAAALGNLVRNSAALCGDLVRAGESISIPVWAIRMTCFLYSGLRATRAAFHARRHRSFDDAPGVADRVQGGAG